MKSHLPTILVLGGISLFLTILIVFGPVRADKAKKKRMEARVFNSLVKEKKIDSSAHLARYLLLDNNDKIVCDFALGSLYETSRVGDSISKLKDDLRIYLYRSDTIIKVFYYDSLIDSAYQNGWEGRAKRLFD